MNWSRCFFVRSALLVCATYALTFAVVALAARPCRLTTPSHRQLSHTFVGYGTAIDKCCIQSNRKGCACFADTECYDDGDPAPNCPTSEKKMDCRSAYCDDDEGSLCVWDTHDDVAVNVCQFSGETEPCESDEMCEDHTTGDWRCAFDEVSWRDSNEYTTANLCDVDVSNSNHNTTDLCDWEQPKHTCQ